MLNAENTVFVIIDAQARLMEVIHDKEILTGNLCRIVQGMHALKIPVVWTEHMPTKIGPTSPQIAELLKPAEPITKVSLSCCGEPAFMVRLKALDRKNVVLAGIESHVCVYQTAIDLIAAGYHIEVAADAVSSRALSNKRIGIDRMKAAGAGITSVETVLFELLKTATHPAFKDVLKIVK